MGTARAGLGRRAIAHLLIALAALATAGADAVRLDIKAAGQRGQDCVFQVGEPNSNGIGSAVLLEVNRENKTIIVATCAHVAAPLIRPRLSLFVPPAGKREVAEVIGGRFDWGHDLAIYQARWLGSDQDFNRLKPAPPAAPDPKPEDDQVKWKEAYAVGYADYTRAEPTPIKLTVQAIEAASRLLPTSPTKAAEGWSLRLTNSAPTAPGMSGGLVISEDGAFVGLVLGRLYDKVNLVLPASYIVTAWHDQTKGFIKVDDPTINFGALPYTDAKNKELQKESKEPGWRFLSAWSWTDATALTKYFSKSSEIRELFQEVVINPAEVFSRNEGGGVAGDHLKLTLGADCFKGPSKDGDTLSVWVNGGVAFQGRPVADAKGGLDDPVIDLAPHLVPGENLVILRKERSMPGLKNVDRLPLDRVALGLMADSSLAVTLTDNGSSGNYRIERSLPGLVDGYSIYLTIRRPSKPSEPDIRMEVDLGWVASLLGSRRIIWDIDVRDRTTGSSVTGKIKILGTAGDAVGLIPSDARGSQSLDVNFPAEIGIEKLFGNFFGVQFHSEKLTPSRVAVKGRLQWVEVSPKVRKEQPQAPAYSLCARLVSGLPINSAQVALTLGDLKLGVDVAPLIQELAINYVNNSYLQPDRPQAISQAQAQAFFQDAALFHGPGGVATPIFAHASEGRVMFGFSTGGPGQLTGAPQWSAGDALRIEADRVSIEGPRLKVLLNNRLPTTLSRFLDGNPVLEGIIGTARLSRNQPPGMEEIPIKGRNFDAVLASYKRLWEAQTRSNLGTFALSLPQPMVLKLVDHLLEGRTKLDNPSVQGPLFVGYPDMLSELKADAVTVKAASLTFPPGQAGNANLRFTLTNPSIRLEPLMLEAIKDQRTQFKARIVVSADKLAVSYKIGDKLREWGYDDTKLTLAAEFPGADGEDCLMTVESLDGRGFGAPFPKDRIEKRTFFQRKGEWGLKPSEVPADGKPAP